MQTTLKVFVPEIYVRGKGIPIAPVDNLGYGIVVAREDLPSRIMKGDISPEIITNRNLVTIEETA